MCCFGAGAGVGGGVGAGDCVVPLQYMRAADAADAAEADPSDTKKVLYDLISASYRYYMSGNDDAVEDLDDQLVQTYGAAPARCHPSRPAVRLRPCCTLLSFLSALCSTPLLRAPMRPPNTPMCCG
jgi:hypothetical protein